LTRRLWGRGHATRQRASFRFLKNACGVKVSIQISEVEGNRKETVQTINVETINTGRRGELSTESRSCAFRSPSKVGSRDAEPFIDRQRKKISTDRFSRKDQGESPDKFGEFIRLAQSRQNDTASFDYFIFPAARQRGLTGQQEIRGQKSG
jgi:hypothetical protein